MFKSQVDTKYSQTGIVYSARWLSSIWSPIIDNRVPRPWCRTHAFWTEFQARGNRTKHSLAEGSVHRIDRLIGPIWLAGLAGCAR